MAEHAHSDEYEPGDHEHPLHGTPAEHERHYRNIYFVLLVLLVASVVGPLIGDALHHSLGDTGRLVLVLITAFGIALVKAYLVVKNFMHLPLEPKYVAYLCTTSLMLMALFFFFVAPDVMNHTGVNWVNEAAQRMTGELSGDAHAEDAPFVAAQAFATTCGACHGATGHGDGVAAQALTPHPANFADPAFWEGRSRDELINVITNGGPAAGKSPLMVSFGDQFNAEQIGELADLIMGFAPPGAIALAPDGDADADADADAEADADVDADAPVADANTAPPPEPESELAPEPAVAPSNTETGVAAAPEPAGVSEAERDRSAEFIRRRLRL